METIVEVYRHVGVKVRIDLSRRGLPASRMTILNSRFDEIDTTTNAVHSDEVPFTPSPYHSLYTSLSPLPSSHPHPLPHHTLTPPLITPLFPLSSPLTLGGGL